MKMKYHAYHIKVFLFCLMVLVSVQFVLFDKIDACPRYLSEDSPLRLHNLIRSEHYKAPDATRHPHNETDDFEAASACILVCDDNHFLIEWIAYHYHVINLRTLIITSDPSSRTSPQHIIDRWKDKMEIEYWNESRFLDPEDITSLERDRKLQMHRLRQRSFNTECLQEMKRRNKGWTILTDTDEFVTLNPRMREEQGNIYTPNLPSIREPGSVMTYLKNMTIPNESVQAFTPCVPIARIQFSSRETSEEHVEQLVPDNFRGSDFMTLRWLRFGTEKRYFRTIQGNSCRINRRAGPVKAVIDLSRMRMQDLFHDEIEGNPHRPLESICSDYDAYAPEGQVALIAHHYLGRLDQWTYRVTDNRGAGYRLARFKDMSEFIGTQENDDMRSWLQGFVESVGEQEALALLKDVGRLEPLPNAESKTMSLNKDESSSPSSADDKSLEDYKVGDIVLADWRLHGEWDWAHITGVFDGGFYNVIFIHDCQEDLGVGRERLKRSGTSFTTKLDYAGLMLTANQTITVGYEEESSSED